MRILITHAYSRENKGDAAILSVLLKELNIIFPNATIVVSAYDKLDKSSLFEGYRIIPNSMYVSIHRHDNIIFKLLHTFYIEFSLVVWSLIYKLTKINLLIIVPQDTRELIDEYFNADLIVPIGGGYLRSKKGIKESINLILLLTPIYICSNLNKSIILFSQSIGPIGTNLQKHMVKSVLNKVDLILAREDHTTKLMHDIGVNDKLVIRTVDAGFLFNESKTVNLSEFLENQNIAENKTIVGITVRKWMNKQKQDYFEAQIAEFINKVNKESKGNKFIFIFIPQVTSTVHNDDDRDVASRIYQKVNDTTQVINLTTNFDHFKLKSMYANLDYIIGTRFHSVIFSLTSYVPAIAIEYEFKTSGIMNDLHLSKWVILIEEVNSENLYILFNELVNKNEEYLNTLKLYLPPYIEKAKEVRTVIKEKYQGKSINFKLK